MTPKSLDIKIARILADPSCKDFILADAKDADMAFGIAAPGKSPEMHSHEGKFKSLAQFREQIRRNVKQGLLDIMLMSASSNEVLTIKERIFDNSHITPAARANDASDVHAVMGGEYIKQPSQPFRSATIDHIMCGKVHCEPGAKLIGADLGLYSVTFNNEINHDLDSLNQYRDFRIEAETKGFRHFLEVFDPNACADKCPADLGRFINDQIARMLAGVVGKGRPLFLKIAYHGPAAMEQLVSYDRTLVVGILGGAAGTTFDAFHQLWEARKYGARCALYGRMINNAECQSSFIQILRWIADGEINDPAEAVKAYHGMLEKSNIRPYRPLDIDMQSSKRGLAYGSGTTTTSVKVDGLKKAAPSDQPAKPASAASDAPPDFAKMTPAQKVEWNLNKWRKVLK